MTVQEAVEYAVTQIVKQGGQCITKDNYCMYADGKGKHCAIGWLLTDERLMKHEGVLTSLIEGFPQLVPDLIKDNLEVFRTLQLFHDSGNYSQRLEHLETLKSLGINPSNPVFKEWVYL